MEHPFLELISLQAISHHVQYCVGLDRGFAGFRLEDALGLLELLLEELLHRLTCALALVCLLLLLFELLNEFLE